MKRIRFVIPAAIVIAIALIGCYLLYQWKDDMRLIREAKARLQEADPAAILAACDSIFTNPVAKYRPWQEVTPQEIMELQPLEVDISPDYIHVPLRAPNRMGFWCIPEGVDPTKYSGTNDPAVALWTNRLWKYIE